MCRLLKNIVTTVKTAKTFGLPIDRTSINSWEDVDFVAAVRTTGRRKLIMAHAHS